MRATIDRFMIRTTLVVMAAAVWAASSPAGLTGLFNGGSA